MGALSVETIRRMVFAAVAVEEYKRFDWDSDGMFVVGELDRPGFEALRQLALLDGLSLAAFFPSIESVRERLVVCEVLSDTADVALVPFWEKLAKEHAADEDFIACAAIGMARLEQIGFLDRLERGHCKSASDRLIFHFGISRLLLGDGKGIDYLIEVLRRELQAVAMTGNDLLGPSLSVFVMHLLVAILRRGSLEGAPEWITWWAKHRPAYQGRRIDVSCLSTSDLAYVPRRRPA